MITRSDRLIERMEKDGQIVWRSSVTYNKMIKAIQKCPVEILAYIYNKKTSFNRFTKADRKHWRGAVAFACVDENYIGIDVKRGEGVDTSTMVHEIIHIARQDLESAGLWQNLETYVLEVGKKTFEGAKRISMMNDISEFGEVTIEAAKSIIKICTMLVTAKTKMIGTTIARGLRSTHALFNTLIALCSGVEIEDCQNNGQNARWIGMCIIAYLAHEIFLASGKKLTKWKDTEEAVAEMLSYNTMTCSNLFTKLRHKIGY